MNRSEHHIRAQEQARALITAYLADDIDQHDAIQDFAIDVLCRTDLQHLGLVIGILVSAVGDIYDNLDDFASTIVPVVANAFCDRGHIMHETEGGERVHYFDEEASDHNRGSK